MLDQNRKGLKANQVLKALSEPKTALEVSKELGFTYQYVRGAISQLEMKGHVELAGTKPQLTDRQVVQSKIFRRT